MVETINPFPGLRPFQPQESELFFGRDEQIGEALDRLLDRRLLAVVGVSGCGKSSLVNAGMLPALEMGLAGDPAQRWRIASMRPGDGPLRELTRCLGFGTDALAERSYGLLEAAETHLATGENLLLVVDQFEEIFPFRERKLKDAGNEADLFVSYLLRAAQAPSGRVYVLLTMRSDYLGECAKFHGLPEALNDGQYLVPRMTRQQLQEAIDGPLRVADVKMQPALLRDLLNQCDEEPDNLPPLQHLLWRLFEEWQKHGERGPITNEMSAKVGGLAGALDQDASQVLADLDEDQKRVAEVVFRRITESRRQADREEEDRPVRRPQTVADLTGLAAVPEKELREVVARFAERGLLVVRSTDAGDKVDLPHECLCLRWTTLKQWIDAEAQDTKSLRFLADSVGKSHLTGSALSEARAWQAAGRLEGAWCRRYLTAPQVTAVGEWIKESGRIVDEAAEREQVARDAELKREAEKRMAARRTALVLGLVALGLAGLGAWAWAQRSRANAQAVVALARQLASRSELVFGDADGIERAVLLASYSLRLQPNFDGDRTLRRQLALLPKTRSLLAHQGPVNAVAFSPDGKWVATGSEDHTARVMEAGTGKEISRLFHQGPVRAVSFSPDGKWVATGSDDYTARVMEAATGREVSRLAHQEGVYAVSFSPDGKWVATGSFDHTARVVEAATGKEISRLAHQLPVFAVAFSPDGKWVATGSYDGTARVMEAATGKEVSSLDHRLPVDAVAFSPDGKWVATGSYDKTARVMEAATGKEVSRLAHQEGVYAVAFSPDGKWVATGSDDHTARVMEAATGKEVSRLAHQLPVFAVAFSPDGKWVATGSDDYTARVMEAATGKEVSRLAHQLPVKAVAFSPDGKWVATGGHDNTARVMEAATGKEVSRLAHQEAVTAVAFSPDGKWVATGSFYNTSRLMEAATGKEVSRLTDQGPVDAVAFSPDGKWVATGSFYNTARVMEAATGKEISGLTHQSSVLAVAFSPDGKWVATGSYDKTARVMEAATGKEVSRLTHQGAVYAVSFSPDGKWVATGSDDYTARVMEAATGKEVSRLAHRGAVHGVAFSPDGKWVATGSDGKTARVMEAATGKEVSRLAHQGPVKAVAFSPDGKRLVTISSDVRVMDPATGEERVRIGISAVGARFSGDGRFLEVLERDSTSNDLLFRRLPLDPQDLIREACDTVTRNLTVTEWRRDVGKEIPYARSCENLPYPPDYKR